MQTLKITYIVLAFIISYTLEAQIYVTDGNKVGIGEPAPAAKVDIKGSSYYSHFYYDSNEDVYLRAGTAIGRIVIDNHNLQIGTGTGTQKLNLNGNMFINQNKSIWFNSTSDCGNRLRLHQSLSAYIDYYPFLYFRYGANSSLYGVILHSNGYMSINFGCRTDNPTYPLEINGYMKVNGTVIPSDGRLKTNIEKLNNNTSKLLKLNGVMYDYNKENIISQKTFLPETNSQKENVMNSDTTIKPNSVRTIDAKVTSRKHLGFIAEELKNVFPELVFEDNDGYLGIDYISLIPVIIESFKEQQSYIEKQEAVIKSQNEALETLKKEISEIKKQIKKY